MKTLRRILLAAALALAGVAHAQTGIADLVVARTVKYTGAITPTQLAANTNDWAPTGFSTCSFIRASTDASRNLTGLAGGAAGRFVWISNVGSFNLVIKDESSSSTAANRFALDGDITLVPNSTLALWYDATASRWQTLAVANGSGGITALTGDVTATGPGSAAATLANTAVTSGSYGSSTQAGTFTVDSKGRLTAAGSTTVTPAGSSLTGAYTAAGLTLSTGKLLGRTTASTGQAEEITPGSGLTYSAGALDRAALTGDVTASAGGNATTLATVNSNVGSFGDATHTVTFTINGKGLVTAASQQTVTPAIGNVTGLGSNVATALGTAVGTDGAFVVKGGALGTPSSGVATNLTGTASGLTAGNVTTNANLTGDVTSVGNAATLANVPSGTPHAGSSLLTNIAAPSSPASGKVSTFADSTDLRFHDKNASGTIGTTVVADTGASNNFLTAISAAGVVSKAQPSFTNISGSVAASQMPALTGDVTTSAGAVATTLATVNSNVGTFGSATQASVVTVNAKGLVTAASQSTVTPAVGSITGFGTGVGTALTNATNASGGVVTYSGSLGNAVAISYASTANTVTYGASTAIDMTLTSQTVSLTGNVTFTTSNKSGTTNNQFVTLRVICDGTNRTLTFPGTWVWVGSVAPTTLTASKVAVLSLTCYGTTDADVVASWTSSL